MDILLNDFLLIFFIWKKLFYFSFQAQTDGIVMVSFYPHFISCGEKSTLEDVAGKRSVFKLKNG